MNLCMSSFPFGFESWMWDLIVLIPEYCISIYFTCFSPAFQWHQEEGEGSNDWGRVWGEARRDNERLCDNERL